MPKISKEQQIKDEKKILAELQKNSRENIETLSKHCGFSQQKTSKIIKRLEKNSTIWGHTTILDAEKQGFQRFILSLKQSNKMLDKKFFNQGMYDKLEKSISNLDIIIESSYYIHGEYDWVLIFRAKDLQNAKKFTDILFGAYPGAVDKIDLSQVIFIQRDHRIPNPDQTKLLEFV